MKPYSSYPGSEAAYLLRWLVAIAFVLGVLGALSFRASGDGSTMSPLVVAAVLAGILQLLLVAAFGFVAASIAENLIHVRRQLEGVDDETATEELGAEDP